MSEVTRRELLRAVAAGVVASQALDAGAAAHVHHAVEEEKQAAGEYKPKALNEHEYRTLQRLADLIIPPDAESGGGVAGGAPEFIDLLCSQNEELAAIYTGGIGWLDAESRRKNGADFVDAGAAGQTGILDLIAYRKNESPALGPGVRFFRWARMMVVDAFYTSRAGIKDLGFMGNTVLSEFKVPGEIVEWAVKRSPLG